MASLETLLLARNPIGAEENLESGRIFSFTEGNTYTKACKCWCWCPTSTGTVDIEVWGAGGSGARMCCCGGGLPGNSGSYSRKQITMNTGNFIWGCTGFACGNSSQLCFRGCSEPSTVCWTSTSTNGCMCSKGGKGGVSFCSSSPSMYCCFLANGFCATNNGPQCGTVCNQCPGSWDAIAYGGDVNRCGNISCMGYHGCYPACVCYFRSYTAFPPGMIAEEGGIVGHANSNDSAAFKWSGGGTPPAVAMINGAGRSPAQGMQWRGCYTSDSSCGCYEAYGCSSVVPYGMGGAGAHPCPGVRDHGKRGGMGAIRIKFVAT